MNLKTIAGILTLLVLIDLCLDRGESNFVNARPVGTSPNGIPPEKVKAELTIDEGATKTIANENLEYDDSSPPVTYTLKSLPQHGTLFLNSTALTENSTFTQANVDSNEVAYAHDGSETTADSFTFIASDTFSNETDDQTFVITINPVNDPPTITNGNGPISITLSEDGVPTAFTQTTLTASDPDTPPANLTWSVSVPASHGTASVLPTNGDSTVVNYVPNQDYHGSDSFTVQVSDGISGGIDTIAFNLTIESVNDLPVNTTVSPVVTGTHLVNQTVTVSNGTWTDADNDVLTFSYQWQRANDSAGGNLLDLPGATNASYIISPSIANRFLRVRVRANDGNNGATDFFTPFVSVGAVADLAISKTRISASPVIRGLTGRDPVEYELVVTNFGPNDVIGAVVEDKLDNTRIDVASAVTKIEEIVEDSSKVAATSKAGNSLKATLNLNSGATAKLKVTALLLNTATGMLTNFATVDPPSGITDSSSGNNTSVAVNDNILIQPSISSPLFATGVRNEAGFSYTIGAAGSGSFTYEANLSTISGLSIDTATGAITGTITSAPGTYNVPISATSCSTLLTASAMLVITVIEAPSITSPAVKGGAVGRSFSYTITASGTTPVFSVQGVLPIGLNFSGNSITGIPQAAGTATVTLKATVSNGGIERDATQNLQITIVQPPVITSPLNVMAGVQNAFNYTIAATGSNTVSFAITGMPLSGTGLNFDTINKISGLPSAAGPIDVEVTASNIQDGETFTDVKTVRIDVQDITSSLLVTPINGSIFDYQIAATGMPSGFQVSSGQGLPPGLNFDGVDRIQGTPTRDAVLPPNPRTAILTVLYPGFSFSRTLTFNTTSNVPVITSTSSIAATVGTSLDFQVIVVGPDVNVVAAGLPAGLTLNAQRKIVGIPNAETFLASPIMVTLTATNTFGSDIQLLTITVNSPVPVITSKLVDAAVLSTPYSYKIAAKASDSSPIVLSLVDLSGQGALPSFLKFNGIDTISGTPQASDLLNGNVFNIGLRAQNAIGADTKTLVLTISPPPIIQSVTPDAAVHGNGATAQVSVLGFNFQSGLSISFKTPAGIIKSLTPLAVSANKVDVAMDLSDAGRRTLQIVNPDGGTSNADVAFYVYTGAVVGTWLVSTADDVDSNNEQPTFGMLRFALQNLRDGDRVIFSELVFGADVSNAGSVINVRGSQLPALAHNNVTIDASNRRVSLNGSAVSSACGLLITGDANRVQGLSIFGFGQSGICIRNGSDNIIGGNRGLPLTGRGPNGEGLRISNCGTFGVEIRGFKATGNHVRGCWIGLDASGTKADANFAGVLLTDGANGNCIGSTVPGEECVIGGNSTEGITITGLSTDNNKIIGTIVGGTAPSVGARSAGQGFRSTNSNPLGNGSTGIFISQGTKGSQIGGTSENEGNMIANNGGMGIEVRTQESQGNTFRENTIFNNAQGGIRLNNGSNADVKPPFDIQVEIVNRNGANGGVVVIVRGIAVKPGTPLPLEPEPEAGSFTPADDGDIIEVFYDDADQARTFLGRTTVKGGQGRWELVEFDGKPIEIPSGQRITAIQTALNGGAGRAGEAGNSSEITRDNLSIIPRPGAPNLNPRSVVVTGFVGQPIDYEMILEGSPRPSVQLVQNEQLPKWLRYEDGGQIQNGRSNNSFQAFLRGTPDKPDKTVARMAIKNMRSVLKRDIFIEIGTDSRIDSNDNGVPDDFDQGNAIVAALAPGLDTSTATIRLNFNSSERDSLSISGAFPVENDFNTAEAEIQFYFGGLLRAFEVNTAGRFKDGSESFRVSVRNGLARFAYKLRKQTIRSFFADEQLTNVTISKAKRQAELILGISGALYRQTVPLEYSARFGKSGSARKAR